MLQVSSGNKYYYKRERVRFGRGSWFLLLLLKPILIWLFFIDEKILAEGDDDEDDEEKEIPPLTKEKILEAKRFEQQLSKQEIYVYKAFILMF